MRGSPCPLLAGREKRKIKWKGRLWGVFQGSTSEGVSVTAAQAVSLCPASPPGEAVTPSTLLGQSWAWSISCSFWYQTIPSRCRALDFENHFLFSVQNSQSSSPETVRGGGECCSFEVFQVFGVFQVHQRKSEYLACITSPITIKLSSAPFPAVMAAFLPTLGAPLTH